MQFLPGEAVSPYDELPGLALEDYKPESFTLYVVFPCLRNGHADIYVNSPSSRMKVVLHG